MQETAMLEQRVLLLTFSVKSCAFGFTFFPMFYSFYPSLSLNILIHFSDAQNQFLIEGKNKIKT